MADGDCVYLKVWRCGLPHTKRNMDTHLANECPNRKPLQEQQKKCEKEDWRATTRIWQKEQQQAFEEKLQQQQEVHASYVNNLRLEVGAHPYKINFHFQNEQYINAQGLMYIKIRVTFWS